MKWANSSKNITVTIYPPLNTGIPRDNVVLVLDHCNKANIEIE
jgi:hypothetical protein